MLVLSRKKDESIVIGGHIIVKVLGIQSDKVRLGIIAPPDTRVDRMEVHNAIQREQSHPSPSQVPPTSISNYPLSRFLPARLPVQKEVPQCTHS